ncbi:MAG: ABC transporter ATP-binding protein [Pirellulaceae bacterium]
MSKSFAVEVDGLFKTYREGLFGNRRFEALKGVSFNVQQGEVFGLLGPNGAGKTTFLKILLGIISKTKGQCRLLGQPAGSRSSRSQVGYLPEHLRVPPHLTAYTALEFYGNLVEIPSSTIRSRRDRLIELVGLTGRTNERVKRFSKGMLQRLGLAQALLNDPKVLILDEPTDGLDPMARADVRSLIMKLKNDGVTVFVNSHILQEVEMVCDRVAILDQGQLRFIGSVNDAGESLAAKSRELSVDFVIATPEGIEPRTLFPERIKVERTTSLPDGCIDVQTLVPDQNAVDAVVDSLRERGVSIVGIRRRKASLEEAFLSIVKEQN